MRGRIGIGRGWGRGILRAAVVLAVGAGLSLPPGAVAEIVVGMTRDQVVAQMGRPEMEYSRRGVKVIAYQGLELELDAQGRVTRVPERFEATVGEKKVVRDAENATAAQAIARRAAPRPAPSRGSSGARHAAGVRVVSNGGKQVNLSSLVGRGKVTVVDFYADWCGPCRQIAPHLERLAASDSRVNVVKVDIVKWDTPVAKQFGIRSIPDMRVYNAQGKQIGKPTSSYAQVMKNVKKAK